MLSDRDAEFIRELNVEIIEAATQAAALTRQLLEFSRPDSFVPRVIEVTSLVTNLQKMLSRLIPEEIRLTVNLGEELAFVRADPVQIEQVLVNLVVNARDAMPKGGELSISVDRSDLPNAEPAGRRRRRQNTEAHWIQLSVRDTGIGMDTAVSEQVFEPFFTTKSAEHGTALGLATVYGIVKRIGGEIKFESKLGAGTESHVFLPAEESLDITQDERPHTRPKVSGDLSGTETLLVVEDESRILDLLRNNFEALGYRVLEASNGEVAMSIARTADFKVDLLLTDVVMPRMGGPELLEKLRRERPDIKAIFVSGYAKSNSLSRDLPGDTVHVKKPFRLTELSEVVRSVLDDGLQRHDGYNEPDPQG